MVSIVRRRCVACLFFFVLVSYSFAARAQHLTQINPARITLRGVSMSSLYTAMMVGDSNYVAVTHSAFPNEDSLFWTALQSPFASSTMLDAVAYAGDTLHAVIAGEKGSLAWTSNGGNTWTPVTLGTTGTIRAVTWNKSTSAPVLLAVGDGAYLSRSTDQGVTWKKVMVTSSVQLNAVTFGTPSEAVAVGNDTTIIQSHDGGQTWAPMLFPYDFHTWYDGSYQNKMGAMNFTGVAMGGSDSVWVCFDTAMTPLLVYKGTAADTSQAFYDALFGGFNLPVNFIFPFNDTVYFYPHFTSVQYIGIPGVLLTLGTCTGDFTYLNKNFDSHLEEYATTGAGDVDGTPAYLSLRFRGSAIWRIDTTFVALMVGDECSLYRYIGSPNSGGLDFTRRFPPFPGRNTIAEFLALSFLPDGSGFNIAAGQHLQRTSDAGRTWSEISLPLSTNIDSAFDRVYALDSISCLIVGWGGVLHRYDPSGFHLVNTGTTERLEDITFPSHDTGIIIGDFGKVLQSTDRGNSWTIINNIPTSERLYSVAFMNDNVGVATGTNGAIIRTMNGGSSWSNINNIFSGAHVTIRNVQAFPDGTFLAQAENALLRSTDFGQNWTSILPNNVSDTAGMNFYSPQIGMIAGLSTTTAIVPDTAHLAYTTNGGVNWTPFSIPFWNNNRILFNWVSDHEVLIYGSYGFIDDVVISSSGVSVNRADGDPRSALAVYPNPSSGEVRVDYTTQTSGPVTIELWDESGKKIERLLNTEEAIGEHAHILTPSKALHGAFFLRLHKDGVSSMSALNLQ